MKKSSIFVGLDIHKNSIEIALAEAGRNGEIRNYGKIDGDLTSLDKVVRKLVSKGSVLHFVYEAGPCGYEIYRHLTAQGFDCMVVAPSKIPKQSGNRIKNDRRDAQMLARLHRAGELSVGYRVLYHAPGDSRGGKRKPGKAAQPYLVLYHRNSRHREPENQLQRWLCGRSLVLYHLGRCQPPLSSPFFEVGITSGEIAAGRFTFLPGAFRSFFPGLLAFRAKTGTLSISNTTIGGKKPAAELTMLGR